MEATGKEQTEDNNRKHYTMPPAAT